MDRGLEGDCKESIRINLSSSDCQSAKRISTKPQLLRSYIDGLNEKECNFSKIADNIKPRGKVICEKDVKKVSRGI